MANTHTEPEGASVRRDLRVLVSPPFRTDRHTFINAGTGGRAV